MQLSNLYHINPKGDLIFNWPPDNINNEVQGMRMMGDLNLSYLPNYELHMFIIGITQRYLNMKSI